MEEIAEIWDIQGIAVPYWGMVLSLKLEKPEVITSWDSSGAISALQCIAVIVRYALQDGGLGQKNEILK